MEYVAVSVIEMLNYQTVIGTVDCANQIII